MQLLTYYLLDDTLSYPESFITIYICPHSSSTDWRHSRGILNASSALQDDIAITITINIISLHNIAE
jgi:hypothetical protein